MPAPRSVELFIPEIKSHIEARRLDELKEVLLEINTIDLADGFSNFPPEQQLLILNLLEPARAVEVFEELDIAEQEYLIRKLEDETPSSIFRDIPPDAALRLFKKLPDRTLKRMSQLMKIGRLKVVRNATEYPPNTAGSLMQTEFIPVNPEMTARSTLEHLQASVRARKEEFLSTLYVTTDNGRLVGGLGLRTLISAPTDIKVKDIMTPVALIKIPAKIDQEEAARIFSRYKLISAPVVDEENRLVGVLAVDDIIQVIQEEATEDIAMLAGTKAEELETGSFLRVTTLRMPWLLASYVGGILVAFIIGHFEEVLSQVVAVASFIPVIAGMGGNVGTQSSTIVVRGLATGRIQMGEIWKVIRREFAVGLTLGLTYGLFLSITAYLQHGDSYSIYLPVVVGVGILTSMTVAATMGTVTPILFKKLNIDPAAVSAPFVSTATDIISICVYFFLASSLLL